MREDWKKLFHFLYGPLFRVYDFFVLSYRSNRKRLNDFLGRKKVSSTLQILAVIFLILWIVIFSFAPEEKRHELTNAIKQSFDQWQSSADQ